VFLSVEWTSHPAQAYYGVDARVILRDAGSRDVSPDASSRHP
jgi:hypothetical protein